MNGARFKASVVLMEILKANQIHSVVKLRLCVACLSALSPTGLVSPDPLRVCGTQKLSQVIKHSLQFDCSLHCLQKDYQ